MQKKKNKRQPINAFTGKIFIFATMPRYKNQIQVRFIPIETFTILQNISDNTGVKISTLVRTKLQPIIEAYSDGLKKEKDDKITKDILIKSVSLEMETDIRNISKNMGITYSAFLKPHLKAIADSYPESLKQKINLDPLV